MDENNRNFILAIVLSIGVLFAWQFFFVPKHQPPVKPVASRRSRSSRARHSRKRAEKPPLAGRRNRAPPRARR